MSSMEKAEHCLLLNIGVVARGSRCLSIMRDLNAVRPSHLRMKLVAIAAVSKSVACNKFAGETGIALFDNPLDLLTIEYLDLILELTGDPRTMTDLIANKPATIGVLDRQTAIHFFNIATLSSRVTEREAEINLATSFASALLEASPDGVLVIDKDYRIVNSNNSPLINGGGGRKSILGRFCFEVMHNNNKPCTEPDRICPAQETLRTGRPSRAVHEVSVADEGIQVCQVTTYPIYDFQGQISQFVITVRDMTKDLSERIEKRAQSIKDNLSRFVQDDRLASLGRLVASVCHEINNPITSIVTFNKLILSYAKANDLGLDRIKEIERYLGLSVREAMRCGEIVKNLLTFARQKNVAARKIDLKNIVDTIMLLIDHQLELAGIACEIDLPDAPYTAWGDSAQIQQCLMNLIFNAIDAMPHGGKLTVAGGIDEKGDLVWLTVSDTGHGIDADELPRIFEPFYSTKTEGKGVGLGLSMVYGIIREHNGTVEVNSEMGKGTTFRINLPRLLTECDADSGCAA
jgi:two-component system NtrC family sensor kinase